MKSKNLVEKKDQNCSLDLIKMVHLDILSVVKIRIEWENHKLIIQYEF